MNGKAITIVTLILIWVRYTCVIKSAYYGKDTKHYNIDFFGIQDKTYGYDIMEFKSGLVLFV